MNVQRFTGRNAREAIAKVRASLGEHAVVLSNRPIAEGVEILAIPGSDVPEATLQATPAPAAKPAVRAKVEPMSTVSFESYVRERQKQVEAPVEPPARPALESPRMTHAPHVPQQPGRFAAQVLAATAPAVPQTPAAKAGMDAHQMLVEEMKSMRSMIASQLSSLSWFDTVRRSPIQTRLLRLMLGNGFSPALARHMVGRLPIERNDTEADQWLQDVMARNLQCVSAEDSISSAGGVFALVGPTGVGKTTTTAKIAADFALQHGASAVGLITMDTYRMAASDQLRAFGKLLNIPVHTARDAASLADLLELFDKKKLVLIDTVGAGQRDQRLAELFAALPASKVTRLLVLNAAAQAEALDEVVQAYGEGPHTRCVVTKMDEAVTLGGVIDVVVRRRLVVEGIANGQRVPEDWYAARAHLLAEQSLASRPASVFTNDDTELGLLMTAPEIAWMGNTTEAPRHA